MTAPPLKTGQIVRERASREIGRVTYVDPYPHEQPPTYLVQFGVDTPSRRLSREELIVPRCKGSPRKR